MAKLFNPWPGSATYQDPQKNEEAAKVMFCGRDNEIIDLLRLVDNNLFVTLYGPTGVGKSSLLNAGVFPQMRNMGYFPISIRFSEEDATIPYAETVVKKIEDSELRNTANVQLDKNDPTSELYLWNYFLTTSFSDADGKEIYPVLVFDQFEEIFFNNREKAELFMRQIYALLNDNLIVPHESGYSDSTNYRFVASIREDDLYILEDVIDQNHLQSMKNNRYRLKELTYEGAAEIIRKPGREFKCLPEDDAEAETIIDQIISFSRNDDEERTISSLMISLLCNRLFTKGNGMITADLVKEGKQTLKDYCKELLKDWTEDELDSFSELLITEDGRRKRCNKNTLNKRIPKVKYLFGKDSRLLEDITVAKSSPEVEIIHDKFASILPTAISEIKADRAQEKARVAEIEASKKASEAEEQSKIAEIKTQEAEDATRRAKRRKNILLITLGMGIPLLLSSFSIALWYYNQYLKKPVSTAREVLVQIVLMPDESLYGYAWEAGLQLDIDSTWQAKSTLNDSVYRITRADTIPVGARVGNGYFSDTITVSISPDKITTESFYINVIPRKLCEGESFKIEVKESDKIDTTLTLISRTFTLSRSKDALFSFKGVAVSGNDIPVHDAIVVLDDHVARTNETGEFIFYLNDSTELKDQTLYVLKNEFIPFEMQGDSILKRLSKDHDFFTMGSIKLSLRNEFRGYNELFATQDRIYKYNKEHGTTAGIDSVLNHGDSIRLNKYKLLGSTFSFDRFKSISGDTVFYYITKFDNKAFQNILGYYTVNRVITKQFSGTRKRVITYDNNIKKYEWKVDLSAFDKAYNKEHISGLYGDDRKLRRTK